MQPHAHQLPNAAARAAMSVNDLMHTTLRLSDLLAEESELIEAMRYKDLARLHEEKLKLTSALENYQRLLASDPDFIRDADPRTREELLLRADDLAFNVEENFRKISVVRAVNGRVMQAIMDVMGEQHRPGTYGPKGVANQMGDLALSMNLNQRA
jgi:flagellar biosynthesis/type III secretory pathway chaperone